MIDHQQAAAALPRKKKGKKTKAAAARALQLEELKRKARRREYLLELQRRAETDNSRPPTPAAAAAIRSYPLQDLEAMEHEDPVPMDTGDAGEAQDAENGPQTEQAHLASRLAAAEARNEALEAEKAERELQIATLLSAGQHLTGGVTRSRLQTAFRAPAVDLTKVVNKPGIFDGTAAARFHEWKNEVQMYLRVMKFPKDQEAGIVQSYLKGTALAWYMQKIEKLEADGLDAPASWQQLLPLLNERFEHRNPELAARDKLMNLRQGSMTLHQYLKEFEGCYAYIPRWDEADKIHRFLFGLRTNLRAKFCVDPATHSWWNCFDGLVSYITSYISDDMSLTDKVSEGLVNFSETAAGVDQKRGKPWTKPKKGQDQYGGSLGKLMKRTLNALAKVQGGGIQKPGKGRKPASPPKAWVNGSGDTIPTRSKGVVRHCHTQNPQLCLGCYQPGHQVAQCTAPVATGVPEGYTAPR